MPAFLKNKWLWIGLILIVVLVVGFMAFSKAGAAKKGMRCGLEIIEDED